MPGLDHHRHPYDEGTITKLDLFEKYAEEWLPTMVMGGYPNLYIFDFFAGTGKDSAGVPGSSLRLLRQIERQQGNIFQKGTHIHLMLNEYDKGKFELLKKHCQEFIAENAALSRMNLDIDYRNSDFETLFSEKLEQMKKNPSLVYFDQNGVKFLSDQYLSELAKMNTTDFMYFISSSYVLRFGDTEQFQSSIKIDLERAKKNPYKHIHRSILKQLRERIPAGSHLRLYPFTIKKNTNIYGVIFGATHPRAIDKFMRTAWKMNSINGEANFDIDDETNLCHPTLFDEGKPTKIESFQTALRRFVLAGRLTNNKEVYVFTLRAGHIPEHASDEIKKMKKEGHITYDAKSPSINYESTFGGKRKSVVFTLTKKES